MNRTSARWPYGASTIGVDYSIKYPYRFTKMSISPYGRDVVLGGRAGLAIIDLEFPLSPPRTISIDSMWKISKVAWCPSLQHHGWVGTAVNQTLVVHDLANTSSQPMRVVRAHPMAITDIAWAPLVPSWIGTTSIDPIVKIWDVRRDQKPVWYFSRWEPADLLAFNNVHMHRLATVHRNKIAIWDIRYGSSPLMTLDDAHSDDITSISWHPTCEDTIVSASRDGTVKRWNVEVGRPQNDYVHVFGQEVLGAEYLPFGDGLLVTQGDSLAVVRDDAQLAFVHQFVGHAGAVLGSEWRSQARGGDGRVRHQLVTWGHDQVLRMWTIGDRMVDNVGTTPNRTPRVIKDHFDELPSFATNFLRPHELLHLYDQHTLPSDLLLAASGGDFADITTWHELSRTGDPKARLALRRMGSSEDFGDGPVAQRIAAYTAWDGTVGKAGAARASTTDEHSSDDDEEAMDETNESSEWTDEVDAAAQKYRPSKAVSIKHISRETRECTIVVGVPWITRETATVDIKFPARYPQSAAEVSIGALGQTFGLRSAIESRMRDVAGACAAQGVGAVDYCMYTLLLALISAARSKKAHKGSSRASAEDLERLPLPPTPLDETRGGRQLDAAQVEARLYSSPFSTERMGGRTRSTSLRHGDARWVATSYTSEENASAGSYANEADYSDDQLSARLGKDDDSRYSDNDEDEDDDDEEFYALGYDDDMDNLYVSDSPAEMPVGLDGMPKSLRHATNRERFDSHIPFPRLCGGVFSGPGQLVCFFASIYALDKFPEPGGEPGSAQGARERSREDMVQQLRMQSKPRNYRKLEYYQNMVQFGSQNKGSYLTYGAGSGAQLINGRGFGESDDDVEGRDEAQDEEVPRYYFRQQISRATASAEGSDPSEHKTYFRPMPISCPNTGIGNLALICNLSCDRSADRSLARQFVLTGPSSEWICSHNSRVALLNSRSELSRVWALLACLLGPVVFDSPIESVDGGGPSYSMWATHPPVLRWLRSVMAHYQRRGDVQTLALLACVLSVALAEASAADEAAKTAAAKKEAEATAVDIPPWAKVAAIGKKSRLPAHRNVSFRLPSSSAGSANPPATTYNLGGLSESQLLRGIAASQPGSPLLSLDEPLVVRADDTLLQGSGMTTRVPPSDSEPPSPEILKELDSDEIKQNELMMAEGLEDTRAPSPDIEQEHFSDRPSSEHQHTASSSSSPIGAEGGENLWRRLRSNVLSRVHTVGGYGIGAKNAADGVDNTENGIAVTSTATVIPPDNGLTTGRNRVLVKHSISGTRAEAPQLWTRQRTAEEAAAAAQAQQKEQMYMRIKQDFGRLHTRLTVRAHVEPRAASAGLQAYAAYLDHWKLLYARILYKWEMDEKAVEVLKCMQDGELRALYNGMNCQPSVPRHDNLTRTGNPVVSMHAGRKHMHDSKGETAKAQKTAETTKAQKTAETVAEAITVDTSAPSEPLEPGSIEPVGAPWLSCTWCHEYVHGRALICHACGHGGHHDHMQRWFRIVRKQLVRTGLAQAQYVQCASSSSSTSNLLRRGLPGHHRTDISDPLASAVPSLVTANDVVRSMANSPLVNSGSMVNTPMANSPLANSPLMTPDTMSLSDMRDDSDARPGLVSTRTRMPSALSRQLSREMCDSSDSSVHESDTETGAFTLSPYPEHLLHERVESSGDSDEQLRPALTMVRRAVHDDDEMLDLEHKHDVGAAALQRGIPTCPSGCGCNCLYESYKLIIQ